jgi:peptide/nickel transport system substrate-binding protein
MTTRRRAAATALVATALAALLAAPASHAQAPTPGGNLTIAFPANQEPASMDGHIDPFQSTWLLNSLVADPLVVLDADQTYKPGLALSWESSADGKVWTFRLRPGVTFHDGTEFDAAAVKYNIERILDPRTSSKQLASDVGPVRSVEVIDKLTVRFTYDTPWVTLLDGLRRAPLWSPTAAEKHGLAEFQRNLVGTGPFTFVEWVQGDRVNLARNPDYWGPAPALETATFRFISDPTAAFSAMMAGDIDVFSGYPAPENLPQFEADPRFQVLVGSTEGETILAMNNKQPPFDDIVVRQAVSHAIDRQAIIDGAMFGYGTPIGTHFAPHNPDYLDLTAQSNYDPELARTMLAEAGYPDGFTTTMKLPPPSYARRGGEIIAAQLRAVGIETEITNVEWAQWLEEVFGTKDYGLTIVSHTEPFDIGIYGNPDYYFQYDSQPFRDIMAELTATTDPAKRTELVQAAQRFIADDYVNGYLFQLAAISVAKAEVQGLWANAPVAANDLAAISWAQ